MSQGYGESSTSNHLCSDFAREIDPSLSWPPEAWAELETIRAKLEADIAEARAAGVKFPHLFKGTPSQVIDKVMARLSEGLPETDAAGILVNVRHGPLVIKHEDGPRSAPVAEVEEKKELPVYGLRCLRLCTVGLGRFAKTYHPGDTYYESQAIAAVRRDMIEPTDAKARKIIAQFKMEPSRGPDWEVMNA